MKHNEIKHKKIKVGYYGWIDTDKCPCKDQYAHYLWLAAPEIKWIYVEDVGSYQGTVFAIGLYNNKWFIMKDYYGSCSGCGAWGEGGEPETLKDVLEHGELFDTQKEALRFVNKSYMKTEVYEEKPSYNFIKVLEK